MGSAGGSVPLLLLAYKGVECSGPLGSLPPEASIVASATDLSSLPELSSKTLASIKGVLVMGPSGGGACGEAFRTLFPKLTSLAFVHTFAAGQDRFFFPELVNSNVTVSNGQGACSPALAEFAFAGFHHFAKRLDRLRAQQRAAKWDRAFYVQQLRGTTLGIVGYGSIGQACRQLAQAYGMRVIALRRSVHQSEPQAGLQVLPPDRLHELMAESDFIVDCLPLLPDTRHFIDAAALAAMKPTGVICNVGRGATIDEAALVQALMEHRIGGAVLDVFEVEPLPEASPLWRLENVLLAPHMGGVPSTFFNDSMQVFVDQVTRYARGEPLQNVVDKQLWRSVQYAVP